VTVICKHLSCALPALTAVVAVGSFTREHCQDQDQAWCGWLHYRELQYGGRAACVIVCCLCVWVCTSQLSQQHQKGLLLKLRSLQLHITVNSVSAALCMCNCFGQCAAPPPACGTCTACHAGCCLFLRSSVQPRPGRQAAGHSCTQEYDALLQAHRAQQPTTTAAGVLLHKPFRHSLTFAHVVVGKWQEETVVTVYTLICMIAAAGNSCMCMCLELRSCSTSRNCNGLLLQQVDSHI
jgi:hypothetical protein